MRSTSGALRLLATFGVTFALFATVLWANRLEQATDTVTLAWDASNGARGYHVHLGTESRVYDQSYDAGRSTSFVFSDGIPGTRYYFAVTAYDSAGNESAFSNEVSISIGAEPEPPVVAQSCTPSPNNACPGARVPADTSVDSLGTIRGMAVLPDERVMFVEDARRVRVLGPSGLGASPSLHVQHHASEFTEIVVDPLFSSTSSVFVGTTELQRDGQRDFRVVRYRLVHDTLGEGVTIVGGLSFDGEHAPRFTIDAAGRIYIAMPAPGSARRDPYAGRILRFAADGSVPDDQRGMSPILADGLAVPTDLDWDGRDVWIVGFDDRSRPMVGRLVVDGFSQEWPRRLSTAGRRIPQGFEVSAFDVAAPDARDPSPAPAVILDGTHRLHRVTPGEGESVARLETLDWPADTQPVDVAIGPRGSIHVLAKTVDGEFVIRALTEQP